MASFCAAHLAPAAVARPVSPAKSPRKGELQLLKEETKHLFGIKTPEEKQKAKEEKRKNAPLPKLQEELTKYEAKLAELKSDYEFTESEIAKIKIEIEAKSKPEGAEAPKEAPKAEAAKEASAEAPKEATE
eukprot:CAMPEP_0196659922 /NCGR_PEP_ID=MMETSP1086-20130531/37160_1 /TAXON_ID=77921 /ORGANISM="Cyanoptyche  gloeocystis , Strain SAG4.97" /LENGTH=130 /DNA_ID=CAMNT_0041994079 /DNA_START=51 /DNA_END=443 /DNA_ORIENTATION=+